MSTREKIIDAAVEVVRLQGPTHLTLDEAARVAGVSKGGVLYHFRSKDHLLAGMIERMITDLRRRQQEAYAALPPGPYRKLRSWMITRLNPAHPQDTRLDSALLAALTLNPSLLEPVRAKIAEWQAEIEDDEPDPILAALVAAMIDGLWLNSLLALKCVDPGHQDMVIARALSLLTEASASIAGKD